ncbi:MULTISPECIES: hypothetical protein [unclassified Bacillus (in: firmicutes)]|uniref:hypothetical protein n=1 Tax=unclassified Bacillus (in: firmicutes) TaxID=185979 RepID=UPI00163C4806|nr:MULTISPECIES: hypothetical protein [unclassified Bacillus (in: firmicutes)]QNH48689.1 hypothetical protein H7F25_04240 [Bacillus sp. PAMC28571]QNK42984.1 hypothetical protein H7F24_10805 [Bacillus sp. PAMC22265]
MTKTKDHEIAELRQAMAALIAENERMVRALRVIEEKSDSPVRKNVDDVPITVLYEIKGIQTSQGKRCK